MTKQNIQQYTLLEQVQWAHIALLMPIYQENGHNACRIYYSDGSYDNVRNSCATVREHWAHMYSMNVKEAEKVALKCEGYHKMRRVSIQLQEGCTLVPVTCRTLERRNSGTLGYVVAERLYEYRPTEDGETLLRFYPNHKGIVIPQKYASVYHQMLMATQLDKCIKQEKERKLQELNSGKGPKPHIGHNWDK